MPKLFYKNEWFYEISPTSMPESEFERILVQNASIIRPQAIIVPYKKTVYDGSESAQADLAIISNDYRHWTVVEVEMIHHSLQRHVIPQIRTLRGANYNKTDADYLAAKEPTLDALKLGEMMRGQPPNVLVIVNKADAEWRRELRRYGAQLMIFEIYRSVENRYVFSVDGDLPIVAADVVTHLEVDRLLLNFLIVLSPAALDFKKGVRVPVFFKDQITEWERVDIQTSCYLAAVGQMPLTQGLTYILVKTEAGEYIIRPASVK